MPSFGRMRISPRGITATTIYEKFPLPPIAKILLHGPTIRSAGEGGGSQWGENLSRAGKQGRNRPGGKGIGTEESPFLRSPPSPGRKCSRLQIFLSLVAAMGVGEERRFMAGSKGNSLSFEKEAV